MIRRPIRKPRKASALIREFSWEELQTEVLAYGKAHVGDNDKWLGGSSQDLADRMRKGDPELADRAEGMFSDALEAVLPSTEGGIGERESSPVGAYPNVPAYLQGRPDNMFHHEPAEDLGMFRLFVDISSSAVVGEPAMLARGLACAALVYAIQMSRPVELWIVAGVQKSGSGKHFYAKHRIGLAPLDLSRVALAVSSIGLGRRMYAFHGETNPEAYHREYGGNPSRPDRELLGLADADAFVPFIGASQEAAILDDPMGWVLARMAAQLAEAGIVWTGKVTL